MCRRSPATCGQLINPWRTLFEGAERLYRLAAGAELSLTAALPAGGSASGRRACCCSALPGSSWSTRVPPCRCISRGFAVGYSVLTFAGMLVFGREIWLQHGEVFTVVFGTFARFAPTQAQVGRAARQLLLRPFGAGLLDGELVSTSMMAFVLLLLATVLFDGRIGTSGMDEPRKLASRAAFRLGRARLGRRSRPPASSRSGSCSLGAYLAICAIMAALVVGRARRWSSRAASHSRSCRSRSAITSRITSCSC